MNRPAVALTVVLLPLVLHAGMQSATLQIAQPGARTQEVAAEPVPDKTVDLRSGDRDFEATFYRLSVPRQTSGELDYEIRQSEQEPLLRSGIIVVRRFRPIIRGKEGGATSFGTAFGLAAFDLSEPVTSNNLTRDVTVHYELYMRRTPVELDEQGKDKHLVFWFRKDVADTGSDRVELNRPWMWALIRTPAGGPAEVAATGDYGTWTGVPEAAQKAGVKLYAALNVGAEQ